MKNIDPVATYIQNHPKWSAQLIKIRSILLKTTLDEEIKWGVPSYSLDGKLILGMAAFKNHFAIWFHQGVFLKDKKKVLLNAQEGKTKALRQWRFTAEDTLNLNLIEEYIKEAIENQKAGKRLGVQRNTSFIIPPLLKKTFKDNPAVFQKFKQLTPGRQKEYAQYIAEAKKDSTKLKRIQKCIPLINNLKGLNDAYK